MENTLPKNWSNINLKDSVDFRKGKKPKRLEEVYFEGSVPYMDIQALEKDYISFYADSDSAKYFKDNDVVIVWDGSRSGLILKPKSGAIGSTLGALSPIGYESQYLYYFLLSHYETINSKARGVGIPHVDPTYLWNLDVPLPPLAEQERIVTKLDDLFAQHEKMKQALVKIPQLLKDFRQQVLTQAVTGKLTEQWREGKELYSSIEEIIVERNELVNKKKLKKIKYFGEITEDNKDLKINNKWNWIRWVDLLDLSDNAMKRGPFGSALKKDFFVQSGIRVFEQYNPINDDPYFQRYYITKDKFYELEGFVAKPGDLLISCSGVTLGRITEIPQDTESGIINQALLKLTLNNRLILNSYFINLFRSEYIQKKIFDNAKGSAIPNMVGVDELKKIPLPVPSLEEQQEIVSRVESLFAKADAIEARYQTLKAKIDSLPQAILHKAFKGELVPQLPTDGDAKELLAEIIKLKEAAKPKKKVTAKKNTTAKKKAANV